MIVNSQCFNCQNFNKEILYKNCCKAYDERPDNIIWENVKCKFLKKEEKINQVK